MTLRSEIAVMILNMRSTLSTLRRPVGRGGRVGGDTDMDTDRDRRVRGKQVGGPFTRGSTGRG